MCQNFYTVEVSDFMHEDPLHKAFNSITGKSSIHNESSIKFYKETLKCKDSFVVSMLEQGLRLPFAT